jgi:predicted lipoprotein with Yx(FWY)xxD motif
VNKEGVSTMPRRLSLSLALPSLLVIALGTPPPLPARAATPLVKTAPARILVNARGMTLYVFSADKPNKSSCTGKCASFWPPALVPSGSTVPAAMAGISGKFGMTTRADGSHQLTFDGAPLYTWAKDKKPGDTTGQGVGGVWWTVVVGSGKAGSGGAAASSSDLVKTAPAKMLVTGQGMTLYVFSADKPNKSTCTGKCATFWPPLLIPAGTKLPITVPGASGKFSATMRADGSQQCSYDGAPLYTWTKDKKPGDVTGEGVGGVWWAVTA